MLPVMVIAGFIFYFIIHKQIQDNTDESISEQRDLIVRNFNPNDNLAMQFNKIGGDEVTLKTLPFGKIIADSYTDIETLDTIENEMNPYRQLITSFDKQAQTFQLTITRSAIKSDELAESIAIALAILFVLLLFGFLTLNRILTYNLWGPFYESLEQLKKFHLDDESQIGFTTSGIKEFNTLNIALNKMTQRIVNDYLSSKQFTENASHEMQTPLTIVKTKIDLLIQSQNLRSDDMKIITDIDNSVNKLSQLNKSLLLLSKIENNQFGDKEEINFIALTDKLLNGYADNLHLKNITTEKIFNEPLIVNMNLFIAESLLSNLLQNAIRHNTEDGKIKIETNSNSFIISNTGVHLNGNEKLIFNRFAKFSTSPDSIGLGLAIVKQVCEQNAIQLSYPYNGSFHTFKLNF